MRGGEEGGVREGGGEGVEVRGRPRVCLSAPLHLQAGGEGGAQHRVPGPQLPEVSQGPDPGTTL